MDGWSRRFCCAKRPTMKLPIKVVALATKKQRLPVDETGRVPEGEEETAGNRLQPQRLF